MATCNHTNNTTVQSGAYVRGTANPLAKAGVYLADEKLFETSIGDPDVQYDSISDTWHAWWSTGLAAAYTAPMTAMGIKHAVSADGVKFTGPPGPKTASCSCSVLQCTARTLSKRHY